MAKLKATIFLTLLIVVCIGQKVPDKNIENLFNPNYRHITYLGMDFSKVKLVGDFSEALGVGGDPLTKNAYFKAWNNLATGEFEKYNIKTLANNKNIQTNLEGVMKMNYATQIDDLTGYKQPDYSLQELKTHAKQYSLPNNEGLGVVLLIESFNKDLRKAFIDYLVIDMKTKEIVMLKKLETEPRGGGLRNYWAGAIYGAFKEIEKNFSKDWKYEYSWR